MKEFLNQSVFFGVAISVLTYELGSIFLKKKLKWPICNPLLISIVAVIFFWSRLIFLTRVITREQNI